MRIKNIPTCLIGEQSMLLMNEYNLTSHYETIGQVSQLLSSRSQQAFEFATPGLCNTFGYATNKKIQRQ